MIDQTNYIVLRGGPLDGQWMDRRNIPAVTPSDVHGIVASRGQELIYRPTGEFEFRDDGARAEIFRFRSILEGAH